MKHFKSIFFLIILLSLVASHAYAYDANIDGVYYNFYGDEAIVTGTSTGGDIVIPSTVTFNEKVYPVTSIGGGAFRECSSLTSITIPEGVTSIGLYAFYVCSNLTSVTIPESVTRIYEAAFRYCTSLTSIVIDDKNPIYDSRNNCNAIIVTETNTLLQGCNNSTIPDGVTSIGEYAFVNCRSLTSITIPESVTSIGDNAFYGCSGLASITIPRGVGSIGDWAFYNCSGLASLIISESLTHIGYWAFYGCGSLTSIVVDEKNPMFDSRNNCNAIIETAANTLVLGGNNSTIPVGVTSIGEYAFVNCRSLTAITIPESVTRIGSIAFSGCRGLTSITIPEGVTSIGSFAFCDCSGLTSITFPESLTDIEGNAFRDCIGLTSITIPKGVTNIANLVFYGCSGLASIVVDDQNPMYDSRNNCNAIIATKTNTLVQGCKNTTIPRGVTSIGDLAFNNCTGLTSISIPEGVTRINFQAFYGCSSLKSIIIPQSMDFIGRSVFYGCSALADVYCYAVAVPFADNEAFDDCMKEMGTLHVPVEVLETYQATEPWSQFHSIVPLTDAEMAVETVEDAPVGIREIYHLSGHRLAKSQPGVNILRMSDGTVRKVVGK